MSRVIATCPNGHDVDVFSAVWRSKTEIPADWKHNEMCYLCGQSFAVTAENCSVIQSNILGVVH